MIEAFNNSIICKRVGSDLQTEGGALRTSSEKERPLQVEIISSKDIRVKNGENFILARYSGMEFADGGNDLLFITIDDIVGKVINDAKS